MKPPLFARIFSRQVLGEGDEVIVEKIAFIVIINPILSMENQLLSR